VFSATSSFLGGLIQAASGSLGGCGAIPLNRFGLAWCADHLNRYFNFHRPCLFAEAITDAKGKTRKRYPLDWVRTPFEKLAEVADVTTFLWPGITLAA